MRGRGVLCAYSTSQHSAPTHVSYRSCIEAHVMTVSCVVASSLTMRCNVTGSMQTVTLHTHTMAHTQTHTHTHTHTHTCRHTIYAGASGYAEYAELMTQAPTYTHTRHVRHASQTRRGTQKFVEPLQPVKHKSN